MLRPLHYTPYTARELKPAGVAEKTAGNPGGGPQRPPGPGFGRTSGTAAGLAAIRTAGSASPIGWMGSSPWPGCWRTRTCKPGPSATSTPFWPSSRRTGWICPCSLEERPNYDVWALFLLCKVLVVYEECSQDPRVEEGRVPGPAQPPFPHRGPHLVRLGRRPVVRVPHPHLLAV